VGKKNITWSELFLETGKIDTPNTPIHDRSLPWFVQALQLTVAGLNQFYVPKPPLFVK
jgi:hypothetical protein